MLTPRRIEIFKAIVDEYIRTAEPVGSKTLQQKYKLPYSSATIRNDMQVLEEMGYLEKTHASSGRVPSTEGYRFYCENLLKSGSIDKKMEIAIRNAFEAANMNIEEAVHQSCAILSEMTNMTAGAIGPDSSTQRLEHIKLFPIDDRNAVCVFITSTGHTETRNFRFDADVSIEDIQNCTEILNDRLRGYPIVELADKMEDIKPDLAAVVKRHDLLFTAFVQAFVRFASENVYFSGKERMLYQPEFSDINKLRRMMTMLDDRNIWKKKAGNEHAVALTTKRGAELTWFNDVAVVRSTFKVNETESGQLMVVGPSRMNYDKVVSMLDYAARMIERMYSSGGGSEEDE
ncbi:MAG: heat-inducible transcriptional repressor HrcA [Solobacterium sp.]|nr:heat-inducible transcriptional repressor HrcA [Solobacterium sp.]